MLYAASFDCKKAKAEVEKTICDSRKLDEADPAPFLPISL